MKFPANKITWDNYWWAVKKVSRWTASEWFFTCRELRNNIPMEEV